MDFNSMKDAETEKPAPLLISMDEFRRMLGDCGKTKAFHLLASGEVESVKMGRSRKPVRTSVVEYVNRLRAQSSTPARAA